MELNDYQRGFIVGLLEGEGSISIHKCNRALHWSSTRDGYTHHYDGSRGGRGYGLYAQIKIANTDKELLEYAQKIIGGKLSGYKVGTRRRLLYQLRIHSNADCLKILKEIAPYLVTESKRLRAEAVIRFLEKRIETLKRFGHATPYTDEEVELAKKVREIPSLRDRADRNYENLLPHGVLQRKLRDDKIKNLVKQGNFTQEEIAKKFNITDGRVWQIIHETT